MQIAQIFPYIDDLRYELFDLLGDLTQEQWNARFGRRELYSAEQIIYRLTDQERWWIGHVCQGLPWDEIRPQPRRDKDMAIEQLRATFELTNRFVETLELDSLRYVRSVPPDTSANRMEENRRIDWILWQILSLEIAALSQITLLIHL
jgi:uncharacterized damage-inducible protein DinB